MTERTDKIIVAADMGWGNSTRSRVISVHGIARTIMSSDYKDPMCILPPPENYVNQKTMNEEAKIKQIGNAFPRETRANPQRGRIYDTDGISSSIQTFQGGGLEPLIVSYTRGDDGKVIPHHLKEEANTIHTATGSGGNTDQYVAEPRIVQIGNVSKPRKNWENPQEGKVFSKEGVTPAILSTNYKAPIKIGCELSRVRKLTERECFRLMDVRDNDIDKIQAAGISKTQQYKMAGNSIVVNVLFHIFRKMFVDTESEQDGVLHFK